MDFHFPLVYVNCVLFDIVMAIAYAMPVVGRTGVSVFSGRSVDIPRGAMWASSARKPVVRACPFFRPLRRRTPRGDVGIAPYAENARCFFVGADALIGPGADGMGVSVFSARSGDAPGGAMWASPSTLKTHVVFCMGRCPHRPESRRYRRVRFFRPLWRRTPWGDVGIAPLYNRVSSGNVLK